GVEDSDDPMAPFIHRRPDGQRGTYALMADGSVRWIREGTNPAIFKGMVTRAGGEDLAELDKLAPVQQPPKRREAELRGGGGVAKATSESKVDPEELKKLQGRWKMSFLKNKALEKLIPKEVLAQLEAEDIIEGTQMTGKIKGPNGEITIVREI